MKSTGTASDSAFLATTRFSGQSTRASNIRFEHTVVEDNHVIADQSYLARAIANGKHGCLVAVGDFIQYERARNKLFLQDAAGRICKLDIVRQERIAAAQTAGGSLKASREADPLSRQLVRDGSAPE